jgi:tetratricopeptide (TPR) repeat protein
MEAAPMNVDLEARTYSPEQAEEILAFLYRTYHGLDRPVDETARKDLLPLLMNYGFAGQVWVTDVIVHSDEVDERVTKDLTALWQDGCWREPTESEIKQYGKWPCFLGERGKAMLEEKIALAEEVRERAGKLTGEGKPEEALALLEDALPDVIAGRWVFWHEHGLASMRQGKYTEAISSYQRAIDYCRDDNWIHSCEDLKGCYASLAKQDKSWYDKGYQYFQTATKRFPKRWIAWHDCGWMAWRAGKPAEAIPFYHGAIKLQSDVNWQHSCYDLSRCYERANHLDDGIAYFAKVTADRPELWPAWHNLALLTWHRGDTTSAVELYRRAITEHPTGGYFFSWQDLGWCLNKLGRCEEALTAHRQARDIADPGSSEEGWGWHGMGNALGNLGRWDEALNHYREALKRNPKAGISWIGLGNCYRFKPDPNHILAWLACRKGPEVDPTSEETRRSADEAIRTIETQRSFRVALRKLLEKRLDLDELKVLCFDLEVRYDNLKEGGISAKITEVLDTLLREDRIMDLIVWIQDEWPNLIPSLV